MVYATASPSFIELVFQVIEATASCEMEATSVAGFATLADAGTILSQTKLLRKKENGTKEDSSSKTTRRVFKRGTMLEVMKPTISGRRKKMNFT